VGLKSRYKPRNKRVTERFFVSFSNRRRDQAPGFTWRHWVNRVVAGVVVPTLPFSIFDVAGPANECILFVIIFDTRLLCLDFKINWMRSSII